MDRLIHLRTLLLYAVSVPLAITVGYALARPGSLSSVVLPLLIMMTLSTPLILAGHHLLLVIAWNMTVNAFFLPGQPSLWIVVAVASLGISLLQSTVQKNRKFLTAGSPGWSLICLASVVLITAYFTGGIEARALGSDTYGGKRYLWLLGAIIGFFALTAQPVPPGKALLYVSLYFLSGTVAIFGNLIFAFGPDLYFLFLFFAPEQVALQTSEDLPRYQGVARASLAIYAFMIMRFGIRGLFDLTKPWRIIMLAIVVIAGLFGGFRSSVILFALIFACQFVFEGLHKTSLLPKAILAVLLGGALMFPFIDRMPLAVQRSVSFLPVKIDPAARQDASNTLDWRFSMWKVVLPDVPKYFFLGKGFGYSGTDYTLTQEAAIRGIFPSYEGTLISGNYHNGWLTMIIPFGIWGVICFLWFCAAALKVLYQNWSFGPPQLKQINTFLLAYFVARLLFYVIFYGQFDLDLYIFTGVLGLSIALNSGLKQPEKHHYDESNQQIARSSV